MLFFAKESIKKGKSLLVRNATIADAGVLLRFTKKVAKETPFMAMSEQDEQPTINEQAGKLEAMAQDAKSLYLVALIDEKIVGTAKLQAKSQKVKLRHRCELCIAVQKAFWRQGIGSCLMHTIIRLAKEMGYEQMELVVSEDNVGAIKMYQDFGFFVTGKNPRANKRKENYYDTFNMVKFL